MLLGKSKIRELIPCQHIALVPYYSYGYGEGYGGNSGDGSGEGDGDGYNDGDAYGDGYACGDGDEDGTYSGIGCSKNLTGFDDE